MALGDWPKNLTTFSGGFPGKALLRGMEAEAGGMDGIRRVERRDPDGTVHVLYTRAGMPTVITTPPSKAPLSSLIRTFIFNAFGSKASVLYNHSTGVLRRDIEVNNASYNVGTFRTEARGKWNDVWRLDATPYGIGGATATALVQGTTSFLINWRIDNVVGTPVVADYGRSALPFVSPSGGPYQASATGEAARSTLSIGFAKEGSRGVAALTKGGVEITTLPPVGEYTYASSANVWATGAGVFRFFGATIIYNSLGTVPVSAYTSWSDIAATADTPYLQELTGGTNLATIGYGVVGPGGSYSVVGPSTPANPNAALPYAAVGVLTVLEAGASETSFEVVYGDTVRTCVPTATGYVISRSYGVDVTKNTVVGYPGTSVELTLKGTVKGTYVGATEALGWWQKNPDTGVNLYTDRNSAGGVEANSYDLTSVTALAAPVASGLEVLYSVDMRVTSNRQAINTLTYANVLSQQGWPCTQLPYAEVAGPDYGGGHSNRYYVANSDLPGVIATLAAGVVINRNVSVGGVSIVQTTNTSPAHSDGGVAGEIGELRTVDYVFADMQEKVFLYMAVTIAHVSTTAITGSTVVTTSSDEVTVKYVLDFRGVKTEFPVYTTTVCNPATADGNAFAPLVVTLVNAKSSSGVIVTTPAMYHEGFDPLPIFSPPFTSQGNCPYIAYTTMAEEAAGAVSEIYMDFLVHPWCSREPGAWAANDIYGGTTSFVAHQFEMIYRRYIQNMGTATSQTPSNPGVWESVIFSAPTRLQFANGVEGPWAGVLGAGFEGNPATEISRI